MENNQVKPNVIELVAEFFGRVLLFLTRRIELPSMKVMSINKSKNLPSLVLESDGQPVCTSCGLCSSYCPTYCIHIESDHNRVSSRRRPKRIVLSVLDCIGCGFCEEICPVSSLKMSSNLAGAFKGADIEIDLMKIINS